MPLQVFDQLSRISYVAKRLDVAHCKIALTSIAKGMDLKAVEA